MDDFSLANDALDDAGIVVSEPKTKREARPEPRLEIHVPNFS